MQFHQKRIIIWRILLLNSLLFLLIQLLSLLCLCWPVVSSVSLILSFSWLHGMYLNHLRDIFNLFVCSCFESVFNFVKTWFLCRFSSVGFWLFVVDSASSLSFFCCWDSTLISFDAMHCYCLSLKPIVFSAAEGIVFVICVRMICIFFLCV